MPKTLFLDMDGVLCDFVGAACEHFARPNPYADGTFTGWDFIARWGYDESYFFEQCDYAFWRNLQPMSWASALLTLTRQHFKPENICILSAPPKWNTGWAVEGKMWWLRQFCPDLAPSAFFGRQKRFFARKDAWLIDDHEDTCLAFERAGGHAILLPEPWNSNAGKDVMSEVCAKLEYCFACRGQGCGFCEESPTITPIGIFDGHSH